MKKLLPIFIILLLSASFVSAGFWDWATGKATDCPPTSLGYRYDSSTDQCTSVTVRGCLSSGYYTTMQECQSAHGLTPAPKEPQSRDPSDVLTEETITPPETIPETMPETMPETPPVTTSSVYDFELELEYDLIDSKMISCFIYTGSDQSTVLGKIYWVEWVTTDI